MDGIRVVIGCDTPVYAAGLASALADADDIDVVCGCAVEVARLRHAVDEHAPDVVVCVVERMGDVEALLAVLPRARLLVVGDADSPDVARVVRGGIAGYISRDEPEALLVDAVRSVAEGDVTYPRDWRDSLPPAEIHLTPRERDVLGLIVACHSNKQIARALGIAEQTVKNQLGHLMVKVGVSSRLQLYKWAADHGLAGSSLDAAVFERRAVG